MKDGDYIESIIFPEGDICSNSDKQELQYISEYHGDHDECWVVVKDRASGQEIARHNTRYIASICLKPKE